MTASEQRAQDMMTEARECFLEADFEQAMIKFTEVKDQAIKEKRWSDVLASETGMAEVSIQQKGWDTAAKGLSAAIDAAKDKSPDARDMTRAHYMLGIAYLGQKKVPEAKKEFEAAQDSLTDSVEDSEGMLSDIQDRLAQTDSEVPVDEDDLMEIAMEFGVAPEEEEEEGDGGEDDLDDDDEEGGEDYDEDEEEVEQEARFARKRPAANGTGDNDEEDNDNEEDDYEEDDEEDDDDGVAEKRARRGEESVNGRTQSAADSSNSKGRLKTDDASRKSAADSGDEVSSSA